MPAASEPSRLVEQLDNRSTRREIGKQLRPFLIFGVLLALAGAVAAPASGAWPERPITVVVMYAPGGGTDTVLRALTTEIAATTGWRINVVNRPGASGGLATRFVRSRPADGYTWLAASSFNKYSRIVGGSDSVSWRDWYYMRAATAYGSWAVRPDSPYKSFTDLVAAAKAAPGEITISTSGSGGQWHELGAVVAAAVGIELRYVPYGSGQLAALAGLNGEVDMAGGGVHEHIQLVESGQLVSLQQTSPEDIVTSSGSVMPSLHRFVPDIESRLPPNAAYNLGIRRDTPIEIVQQIQDAFVAAANSDAFRETVAVRNFAVDVLLGEAADRRAAELETIAATVFEQLEIPNSKTADALDLPTPAEFDAWWPPAGYTPLPLSEP
ncbi:MAG: tripartite tricarboxylate transporter substrate binding protein [Gammaproteobacteria bacterium]|nr:tripartite tricarboxylate transporter substrate binding protein [Gammaproteobacteria bacterium]MDH3508189.1 tripartite tricarboxylate transporter substrate binding protein [Gammaproteobacteria bacterium]